MQGILDLLLKQIFGQPFLLIPIVVFIGYLAMGQKISKALVGGIKASIGVLVMGMGSGALISNFNKVIAAVTTTTGAQGAGLNTYPTMTAGYAVMDSVLGEGTGATWGIYVLLVAFLLNILLVALRKYTHIRALYLTGNAMIVQAGISAFLVWKFLNTGAVATIAIASVLTALYWGIFSTMLIKPTHEITGADFTVAHQQMLSDYLAYKIAPHLGDPAKDDIEKKKLPEVGHELFERLSDNPKSTVKIEPMLSTLPSYTRLGMSALLPHRILELTDEGREEVDGQYCIDIASREKVLQERQPLSRCVQFDTVKNMSTTALREIFTGQQIIYVYHDQIDARGEHTEDEVFNACEEAIEEILIFIEKINNGVNSHHFIVTSDHGFIYKRDKVEESGKIGGVSGNMIVKRRYIVSHEAVQEDGVCNLSLGYLLGNDDDKIVSFPVGMSVFKTQGNGGQNYVHGGSSPQEMIIPLIDVKMERGKVDTKPAQIMLVSIIQKITNLITTLDFIQSDAVSDVVKSATYRIYFADENGIKISNENIYVADNREEEATKRIFRMKFTFKNQHYDKTRPYFLIAVDDNNGTESFRHIVNMDLAFSGDFGFGV